MPASVTTTKGDYVEVFTRDDLDEIVDHVVDRTSGRALRWGMAGGFVLAATVIAGWVRFDARLAAVEVSDQKDESTRAAEAIEIRQLARKVDSLTIILANQTELLRELNRRVR